MQNTAQKDFPIGIGVYSFLDAGRFLTEAMSSTLGDLNTTRWRRNDTSGLRAYTALLDYRTLAPFPGTIDFIEMIEMLTMVAMRIEKMTPRAMREKYENAQWDFGPYPFATRQYSISGARIFADSLFDFRRIVQPILEKNVTYDNVFPIAFSPLGKQAAVLLDPKRSFGSPVIRDGGPPTATIYAAHEAGDTPESIAEWYRLPGSSVDDAIEYEGRLARLDLLYGAISPPGIARDPSKPAL